MEQADLKEQFAKDVLLLRLSGSAGHRSRGGPQIGALMKRLGRSRSSWVACASPTRDVEIVEMVLVGKINRRSWV